MSKITTVNVLPRRIKDTNRVEWELEIPPNVQGYSVESITSYVFNQCWMESEDKIKIDINLTPLYEFDYIDNQDNNFGGIFHSLEDLKLHYHDDNFDLAFVEVQPYGYRTYYLDHGEWVLEELPKYIKSCGIVPGIPTDHDFGEYIVPDNLDWCYSLQTETIWLYYEHFGGWGNTLARTTVKPLRRIYKAVWTDDDQTEMYNDLLPEEQKKFYLAEVKDLESIIIRPYDDIFNEYMELDETDDVSRLKHPPDPLLFVWDGPSVYFTRVGAYDTSRYFFRTAHSDESDLPSGVRKLPLTFNSTVTVSARKSAKIGKQETKGSSIFDAFMQRLNLHIQAATYDYFVRCDGGEDNKEVYVRYFDFIKFASAEGSFQNNYLSWFSFARGPNDNPIYQFNAGDGSYKTSGLNYNQTWKAKLVKTESLKLGGSDVRILYPTTIMKSEPITWGMFMKKYEEVNDEIPWEQQPIDPYGKLTIEEIDNRYSTHKPRVYATRNISFQLFGRDIGWEDEGTSQLSSFTTEAVAKYARVIEPTTPFTELTFLCNASALGFFNLWSLQLYVRANDHTNIDSVLNYNLKETYGPLVSLTNIVFKFTQTSPGYLWLSNSLPHSKIPVGHNRKIKFELLDMHGRKIPLRDSSTGLHVHAGLEVYLYYEDPPDAG